MLKRLLILFFAASLSTSLYGRVLGQTKPSPVEDLSRAAEQSLLFSWPENADRSEAQRLIPDCFNLAQLSAEKHQEVCRGNPVLLAALQSIGSDQTDFTPAQRRAIEFYRSNPPTTEPPSAPSLGPTSPPPTFSYSEDVKKKLIDALVADIATLSTKYAGASTSGSFARRIEAQAHLDVFYSDLQKALGTKSNLLPSDPRACVTDKEVLVKAQNSFKTEKRYYDYSAALAGTPDVQQTVESLSKEIEQLEALVKTDQPGLFHRARSEIEAALDVNVWKRLTATRSSRIAQQKQRVQKEWRAKFPAILIPGEMEPALRTTPNSTSLSKLALNAIGSYLLNPPDWNEAESKLLTTYSRLPQSARNAKPYKQWFPSILKSRDLDSAIFYCKAVLAQNGYQFSETEPFNPKVTHQRYYTELLKALQTELNARKTGRSKNPAFAQIPTDPEALKLQRLYAVRLANDRYSKMSYMPEDLRDQVKKTHAEFASAEFEQAINLYNELGEQMDKAAASNSALDDGQLNQIAKARAYVLQAFERLNEVFDDRIKEGVIVPNADSRKVKVIVDTLKAGRPPNEPVTATRVPDAPTSLILQRNRPTANAAPKPPLQLTDAIFSAIVNNALAPLKELKETMAKIKTAPSPIGTQKGKLILQETDQGIDYNNPQIANEDTRLPERLKKWKGFINPRTGNPYNYQKDVKNFRSFEPVGGGIHFGNDASLAAPTDLTEFILSYDEKTQSLVLDGPENKKFLYGPISPQELKPLLRFARSQQNAAISIGWTGHQKTYERGKESPVLIDPAFVDTKIGNELVKADSIPWRLDQALPNGNASPCAVADFKRADELRISQSAAPLARLFTGTSKFEDVPLIVWQTLFNEDNPQDALVLSIVSTSNLEAAKLDYRTRTRAAELFKSLDLFSDSTDEQKQANNKTLNAIAYNLLLLDKLYKEDGKGKLVLYSIASRENSDGNVKVKWIKLWAAVVKSLEPDLTTQKLATYFLVELPYTTVAVLLDEPTTIQLQGDQIVLTGTMRYRYATSKIMVGAESVMIGASLPKGTNQVKDLDQLTLIANACLPKLLPVYQPLARTTEYAKIVAFLRWARSSKRLLGIDLSNLAAYPGSDRASTPTPDALLKPER